MRSSETRAKQTIQDKQEEGGNGTLVITANKVRDEHITTADGHDQSNTPNIILRQFQLISILIYSSKKIAVLLPLDSFGS